MEQDKKAKLLKEISDIIREQEHIIKLLNENNIQELNNYLGGELTQKHFVEKSFYNMTCHSMPRTVQKNASNAYDFLEKLKREKEAEFGKETLSLAD